MKDTYPVWKMFPPAKDIPMRLHYMEDPSRSAGYVEQIETDKWGYPKFAARSTVHATEKTDVLDIATGMALVEVWYAQRPQLRKKPL